MRLVAPLTASRNSTRQTVKGVLTARAKPRSAAAAREHLAQDVLVHEIGVTLAAAVAVALRAGLLEITVVALAWPLVAGGIDLAAVEAPTLLGIAHQVIGRGDLLELLLGLTISRD